MTSSDRWRLGDVIIWFKESGGPGSDLLLRFYDDSNDLICWVEAYERDDRDAELNCGYLGNVNEHRWLRRLFEAGTSLGVRTRNAAGDQSARYVERIVLDFRIGPVVETSTPRSWLVSDSIKSGEVERVYRSEASPPDISFDDIGLENELEVQAGGPDDLPQ
jgi:hypothetical protein